MKVVQINATCGSGSTGKICKSISEILTEQSIENYVFYSLGHSDYELGIKYSNNLYEKIQALKARIFANNGFNSHLSTLYLLKKIDDIKPDIIHLHNIHSNDCNLTMLFKYIKKRNIKVIWTFHDCWAFTGGCTHFTIARCDKWKTECNNCPQIKNSSWFFDRSKFIYNKKDSLFSDLNLTIVTPSKWLKNLVKESLFREYPIEVLYNGINLEIFKPTESNFREKYNLKDKYIILGVAMPWSFKKGIDVFIELSKKLDDKYQIVLVGTTDNDKKLLPTNIIAINKTNNQKELAEIYSASDLFVNPTREEVLGLVNIESLACGTPVLTFNTGGCPECINDDCGIIATENTANSLYEKIINISLDSPFKTEKCIEKAKQFDDSDCFMKYYDLYKKM